ncbi:MAG: M3 family oligoendopeptidase [Bacteriodetes bacterium]|nr:M3 family oligoendopeptidase [Bacteroidota bacterium]
MKNLQEEKALTGAESVHWDLSDLYPHVKHESFQSDMQLIKEQAANFYARWHGNIEACSDTQMLSMVLELESISQTIGRLGSRVRLEWSTNSENFEVASAMQSTSEKLTDIRQHLIFVSVELRNMTDEHFEMLKNSPVLAQYKHWMEHNRTFKDHTLTELEEKLDSEKDLTGVSAWVRYYDQYRAAARFEYRGEKLSQQEMMLLLSSRDRDVRKDAALAIGSGLERDTLTSTFIFNTVLADKMLDDKMRGYPTWVTARNKANKISDESVETLVESVMQRYDIPERFFTLKKNLLGLPDFFEWDRSAPATSTTKQYSWQEAHDIVATAYTEFHPRVGEIVEEFFAKNWIDAAVTPGKQSGAFSASTVPSVHPYIFMNYTGTPRDVKTLAHELGHGVHQYLSRQQGMFNSGTPLTIAETASVFGEMLVFDSMMRTAHTDEEKLTLLMEKLNDITNTVFRQVALNRFEKAIHEARRTEGELSTKRINELWMQTQQPSFGNSVKLTDNYKTWWGYISHFIHTPGYVYAYAFGELLVLALYEIYKEDDASFKERYINLLSAGGNDTPENLLKPFGIDLTDPKFWHRGLSFIDMLLTQAEEIADRLKA